MSRYKAITFEDFAANYIKHPDGWYPTWVDLEDDGDGGSRPVVVLDMVVPWRLADKGPRFLRIPFETEEQLEAIRGYIDTMRDLWSATMINCRDRLDWSELGEPSA